MELNVKSPENIEYMIEQITTKLKMVNVGALDPSHFDLDKYEDIREVYEMVMKKNTFSPNEMQAIVEELGTLRK
ncbi:DUF1128 domain-containing protein [Heyndrickxia acidicola]|uniref:UPF0435 protein P4T90_03985 n=1 Tax=Heyndrickxia acidicola TaxID=209389 RepID=A0ABU6MCL2_9BACI|nr:DUF1128 domain-containing protein [Heyndrickxia acidicola]MED1202250.1 DUF1128 domain-containing protein [Heyndrickxia acidicola]